MHRPVNGRAAGIRPRTTASCIRACPGGREPVRAGVHVNAARNTQHRFCTHPAVPILAGLLLGIPCPAALAEISRPSLKCLSPPAYYPGAGILFTTRVADDTAYLDADMLRVEFIGEFHGHHPINYPAYDYIVDKAAGRGMTVLGLIDYQSLAHSGPIDWPTDSFRDRFTARTREIVGHYHDRTNPIRAWEIWNEQDIALPEFNVRIDPDPYARLLIAAYHAIKEIDPGATVVLGGLSPKGFEYEENYLADLYATQPIQDHYAAQGYHPFDVVGAHPYPEIFTDPDPFWPWQTGLDDVLNQRIKAVMNANGDRLKKVWLTEMGWSSYYVSENAQANYLRKSFEMLDTMTDPAFPGDPPYVERYFWFKYDDFSDVDRWGLVTQDHARRKPAYDAYLALTGPGIDPPPDPGAGENPPVWNATSDAALPVQVSSDDLLEGQVGAIVAGGFHSDNQGTVAALTNGVFDANPVTLVLLDYGAPALRVRYTFDPPVDLEEVRIFAGHMADGGNRAFQSNDIRINGALAVAELNTGDYGQASGGDSAVSVVRWLPAEGETFVARDVAEMDVILWCASSLTLDFLDRWDPVLHPDRDTDGAGPAYVAPIVKEIDAFGVPSTPSGSTITVY